MWGRQKKKAYRRRRIKTLEEVIDKVFSRAVREDREFALMVAMGIEGNLPENHPEYVMKALVVQALVRDEEFRAQVIQERGGMVGEPHLEIEEEILGAAIEYAIFEDTLSDRVRQDIINSVKHRPT